MNERLSYGKFAVGPFPKGIGATVGNALRRTLLSSLEGSAVTAVKIKGISCEFSTLPGVREDVLQIIANLRQLNVKLPSSETVRLSLKKSGEGQATAADIAVRNGVEILNSDLVIATLNESAELEMEIEISSGRGWRSADSYRSPDSIPVEAHFSPVERASYSVTDEGGLVLEVWTDGSVSPQEALTQATAEIRRELVDGPSRGEYDQRRGEFIFEFRQRGMGRTVGSCLEEALLRLEEVVIAERSDDFREVAERVRLKIETEGGIDPKQALERAVGDLSGWLDLTVETQQIEVEERENPGEEELQSRVSYVRTEDLIEPPDLLGFQRRSFGKLWDGQRPRFNDILKGVFPIRGEGMVLDCIGYELGEPKLDEGECVRLERTYSAPLRLRLRLRDEVSGLIKEEVVSLDLPMMTGSGGFIISGSEWIVVSQLLAKDGSSDSSLAKRYVKGVGDLLAEILSDGLNRAAGVAKESMHSGTSPSELFDLGPLSDELMSFFKTSELSQFRQQINPLDHVTHARRLTALGPSGLEREEAGIEIRELHPSWYGRICAVETPEGPNVGLITSLGLYTSVGEDGKLLTPYRKVEGGKATDEVAYLSAEEESRVVIAGAGVPLNEKGELTQEKVTARSGGRIVEVAADQVDYLDVAPDQILGVSTGLIPLMEHDDPNRALMGANMQRQAVPLLRPEQPLVATGWERKVAEESGYALIAENSGVVERVSADEIVILEDDGSRRIYRLDRYQRSNQDTCIDQRPLVVKGQKVAKGEMITDGPAIKDGDLALGRNVLVAYMAWEGYNFEDGIVVSEKLVRDDLFTSLHLKEFTVEACSRPSGSGVHETDLGPGLSGKYPYLDERGVIKVGTEVHPERVLVGKLKPDQDGNMVEDLYRAPFWLKGRVTEADVTPQFVRICVARKRPLEVGDKMAGRHGNKGVVAKIVPEEDMPFLPEGTPVEMILNPIGIISRLNFGQILEAHLGWAAHKLGTRVVSPPFDGAQISETSDLLEKAGLPRSGMTRLYDGRTGKPFDKEVTVGYLYIMKLFHLVEDKIHARSTGPYSMATGQPLGGKAHFGGQRWGQMEVWALEAYGAAHTLQEFLTLKSDDVEGRTRLYQAIVEGKRDVEPTVPESAKALISYLRGVGLDLEVG